MGCYRKTALKLLNQLLFRKFSISILPLDASGAKLGIHIAFKNRQHTNCSGPVFS